MIKLTRLAGDPFVLNAELIKFVEKRPDTIITLRDGEKILVQDSVDEIVEKSIEYAREIRSLIEHVET